MKNKKIGIVSGHFNPVHLGHVQMIQDAKALCDYLIVVVNNDKQQKLKKGKIIMEERERCEIVQEFKSVDEVKLAIDTDKTVKRTLKNIALGFREEGKKDDNFFKLFFMNGGDRGSIYDIPEASVCSKYGINMIFGIGGNNKVNSSSEINKRRGLE